MSKDWESYFINRPNGTILQVRIETYSHDENAVRTVEGEIYSREKASRVFADVGRALQ